MNPNMLLPISQYDSNTFQSQLPLNHENASSKPLGLHEKASSIFLKAYEKANSRHCFGNSVKGRPGYTEYILACLGLLFIYCYLPQLL